MNIYKCSQCNGEGEIKMTENGGWLPIDASNATTDKTYPCPKCDGDGWITDKE